MISIEYHESGTFIAPIKSILSISDLLIGSSHTAIKLRNTSRHTGASTHYAVVSF